MPTQRPSKPVKNQESAPKKAHSYAKELTSSQKKQLRGVAHGLKALVQIGAEGISPGILQAVQEALRTHELVKVQTQGSSSSSEKNAETNDLLKALGPKMCFRVHLAGRIGRMLILYFEKNPAEAQLPLKKFQRSRVGNKAEHSSRQRGVGPKTKTPADADQASIT